MPNDPAVLILCGARSGCEKWRAEWPVTTIQRLGYPVAWQDRHAPPPANLDTLDAVVLARLGWLPDDLPNAEVWVHWLHRQGKAVLYDCDDDLFSDAGAEQGQVMQPRATEAERQADRAGRLAALRLCDGVTVTTAALAERVRQYTDAPIEVVGNYIPWADWRAAYRQGAWAWTVLTIGWAGGKRSDGDFVEMAEAWGRIARRYPEVCFRTIGYCSPLIRDAVPAAQLRALPWQPVDTYQRAYRGLAIGCAPLADTAFNATKSPIKAFEYAAAGAAVVCSPLVYAKVVRPGIDAFVAASVDDWEAMLSELIEQPERRARMAASWSERVAQRYSLEQCAWKWPAAWAKLIGAAKLRRKVAAGVP